MIGPLALLVLLAGCQCGPPPAQTSTVATASSTVPPAPTVAPTPTSTLHSTLPATGTAGPTSDTGRPTLGPPDVTLAQGGDPTFIGLLGANLMADVIGDAHDDLIIGGAHTQTFLFEGPITSATTLQDAILLPGGSRNVFADDVDGDGRDDLVLSHSSFGSDHSIHLSPYAADREPILLHSYMWTEYGFCVVDADEDGQLDVLTHQGKTLNVYFGPLVPGGVIEAAYPWPVADGDGVGSFDGIACDEDLTGDGRADLVGTSLSQGAVFDTYPHPGDTTYTSAFALPLESPDGLLPVFIDHPTEPEARAMIYPGLQRGRVPYDAYRVYALPYDPEAPEVVGSVERDSGHDRTPFAGDLDGDGHVDLALVGRSGLVHLFYGPLVGDRGRDDWDLEYAPTYPTVHLTVLDANSDGQDDLLIKTDGWYDDDVLVEIWFGPLPR